MACQTIDALSHGLLNRISLYLEQQMLNSIHYLAPFSLRCVVSGVTHYKYRTVSITISGQFHTVQN